MGNLSVIDCTAAVEFPLLISEQKVLGACVDGLHLLSVIDWCEIIKDFDPSIADLSSLIISNPKESSAFA